MSPRTPITLSWNNLSAEIKGKRLISDCTGYCKPGQMLAIMGASGAGKTTLLSLLCQKVDPQLQITGSVLANGQDFNGSSFYNFGVYVYQDDTLHETLTVRETLRFTAILKYGNPEEAEERVEELIKIFELQKCENSFVGGSIKKGISGGEKKRVCIAVEMITRPSLLILDEPTSGLDSHKAGSVVKALKKLANEGCTIIFTIHQPSHLLYTMLSNLILLDKGQTIYQGPAHKISNYLTELNISIPQRTTISDFFIWEISEFKAQKNSYRTPLNAENYTLRIAPDISRQMASIKGEGEGYEIKKPATGFLFMFLTLLQREWLLFVRNPMRFFGCILNAIVGIIIVGFFYLDEIPSAADLINEGLTGTYQGVSYHFIGIQGVSFINITSQVFGGIFAVQGSFAINREIYYKESSSKKYYPIAYFLAKVIVQFFGVAISAIVYGAAGYWINGYEPVLYKFLEFLLVLIVAAICGNSIGFFIGSLFKDESQSGAIGPMITLPLMAFSGMYNKLVSIPAWISWLPYVSPFRYGLHLILDNQYGDLVIPLVQEGGEYNYRTDLGINLSFIENIFILFGLSVAIYLCSFLLLKKLSTQYSS